MTFLPFERITYRTRLSEAEVISRLADAIEPVKVILFSFSWRNAVKPYEGEITGNTFAINRIIRYRNSFLPRITGVIQSDGAAGTIVNVKMQLHPFAIIFLLIWFGFVAQFGFIGISMSSLRDLLSGHQTDSMNLLPLGMIAFVYAITMGGFTYESRKSRNDLKMLFNAEIIEN